MNKAGNRYGGVTTATIESNSSIVNQDHDIEKKGVGYQTNWMIKPNISEK